MSEENKMENSTESTDSASSAEKQNIPAEPEENKNAEPAANEEAAESTAEEQIVVSEAATAFVTESQAQTNEAEPAGKSNKKTIIGVVIAAVVVVAAAVFLILFKNTLFNPYIKDYVDVNGITIGETADKQGMEYSEFLEYFDLPKDMPKSTPQQAAMYNMPAGRYAEAIIGWDFESMKEQLQWGDDITEETTIGDALDQTTVGNYVGEDRVEEFKSTFGLDDSITKDTLWKEVRNIVDTKQKEAYEAEMAGVTETPEEEQTAEDSASEAETEAATADETVTEEAATESAE